ncbi:hypothetical protein BDV10DRAFT_160818 [Aspergillus recurvatus]
MEVSAEQSVDCASEETSELANDIGVDAEGKVGLSRDAEGEPEGKETLEFGTEGALAAGEPERELNTLVKIDVNGKATLGADLENVQNGNINLQANISLEEGLELGLGTGDKSAVDADKGLKRFTDTNRGNTTNGKVANANNIAANLTLNPKEKGFLETNCQSALRTAKPDLEGVDDLNIKVADDTTSGTEFETGLDLPVNLA